MQTLTQQDQLLVETWMSKDLFTVTTKTSVRVAYFKMRFEEVRHLLVTDEEGKLRGVVSDRVLRRPDLTDDPEGWDDMYQLSSWVFVDEVMSHQVASIQPHDSIQDALKLMLQGQFDSLPVTDENNDVIGILTSYDLLVAFSKLWKTLAEELPPTLFN